MKKTNQNPKKLIKLRNIYTGDIVLTNKYDEPASRDGVPFIQVYSENNPKRIFLVNRDAFRVVANN